MKKNILKIFLLSFVISTPAYCTGDDILAYTKNYLANHSDTDSIIETCNRIFEYATNNETPVNINSIKYNSQYCKDMKNSITEHPDLSYLLRLDLLETIITAAKEIHKYTSIKETDNRCKAYYSGEIEYVLETICYENSDLSDNKSNEKINCNKLKNRYYVKSPTSKVILLYQHLPKNKTFLACNIVEPNCEPPTKTINIVVDGHITPKTTYMFNDDCSIAEQYPDYPATINFYQYIQELRERNDQIIYQEFYQQNELPYSK